MANGHQGHGSARAGDRQIEQGPLFGVGKRFTRRHRQTQDRVVRCFARGLSRVSPGMMAERCALNFYTARRQSSSLNRRYVDTGVGRDSVEGG